MRGTSGRVRVVVGDIARWLRDEEAAGSNPATPTRKHQVRASVSERTPALILLSGLSGEILEKILVCDAPRGRTSA